MAEGINYEYRDATAECSHAYLLPALKAMLRDVRVGSTVLDMGCGNGSLLAEFQGRGWMLYGCDFSPTAIAIARANFPNIKFFLADASAPTSGIQEAVGGVDIVLSTEVIEHLYDPRGFLRNAHALLRPGGRIVLSTPYHGYLKNVALSITGKMDSHFTALWDHGHIKFWSKKTLTKILLETGFTDVEFTGAGRIPWIWNSVVLQAHAVNRG